MGGTTDEGTGLAGGRAVAKILVADDNSNIQKMVGLALKDQGIDVVAVGNGEAAVRKISDLRPDLVLADVFMPVRNGYEVCKYVKDDTSLSHIPVILLVGAFDPLDEQEAQRVGADGVLKKPFVPPDPLISMVKSALSRAGVLPGEKPVEPAPIAADMIAPHRTEIPTLGAAPAFGDAAEPGTRAPEPVRIDSAAPLAFGNLLETPVTREVEEDLGYMPAEQTQLAPERTWGSSEEPEEAQEEEEEQPGPSWRRSGEEFEDDRIPAGSGAGDWRDTVVAETPAQRAPRESWEPTRSSAVETREEPVTVAATESLPTPISAGKPAAPFAGDAWSAATANQDNEEKRASRVEAVPVVESAPSISETGSTPAVLEEKKAEVAVENTQPRAADNWFAPTPSPWDAALKKASELATGWDSPLAEPARPAKGEEPAEFYVAPAQPSVDAVTQDAGLSSSAVEVIREETAVVAETEPAAVAGHTAAVDPKMDDLVAKVLAKMSPDVLQAVTREILKPVVEAMVRDELNSKKS
jgi:CheY-like chemotaxis protein